jgi:outer membrane protein OmpA-like peptidoglycan-associated protein
MSRTRSPRELSRCVAVALALSLTLFVAACGGGRPPGDRGALAIVVSPVASVGDVASSPALADAVSTAAAGEWTDSIVVADGDPHIAARGSLGLTTRNGAAQRVERGKLQRQLLQVVEGLTARAPEMDLLGAVSLAARDISAAPGRHVLVVISSGLSTVAPLAFQEPGLLGADPQDVVKSLQALHGMPELDGVTVIMSGFGDTAGSQPDLGAHRLAVVSTWQAVFTAAGANVEVDPRPLAGEPGPGLPPVLVVPVPAVPSVGCTTVLSNSVVAFRPDEAELVDPAGALEILRPLADRLAGTSSPVTVTGTTARVGPREGQIALARARAERIAELLGRLGIDRSRLIVDGLGSYFPEYVSDHDAGGVLLPGPAATNRSVRISAPEGACAAA